MNKQLLIAVISLVLITGMFVDNTTAQAPPDVKVSLALAGSRPDVSGRLVYLTGDPIQVVLTLKNNSGQEIITSKGFEARKFYLFLTFIDPDGKGITAKYFENIEAKDPPPPQVIPLADGTLLQVEPVEILPANWSPLPYVLPNAHAYYRLMKPGNYSVKAIIHMGTFPEVFYTDPQTGEQYAKIENSLNWAGDLLSNIVHFTLLTDADGDGFYYPEGYGALADCNDSNSMEKPGQTWYRDADNDGYSDGTTNTTSCTRPSGYRTALELAGHTTGDCDDNNPGRNPGISEVACNGVDDDCNSATPDVPAPTLASPANGATNVSTTPTLSWSTISCATSYGIQVATTQSFSPSSTVVIDQTVTSTSFSVSTPLSNNTIYYWRVNAKKSGETSAWSEMRSFTTVGGPTGTIVVKAVKYTIGLGHHPSITQSPIVGMPVRVFAKSPGSCAAQYGIISWPHYREIWDNCPIIASGSTNASGKVTLSVPPGTYIVIGKYDEKYVADNVLNIKAGQTREAFLPFIVVATGKGLSCKYSQHTGSNLLVIEPEHVEWDGEQEQYPFVFQSEGDWTVETSVTPPEGFVSDYSDLSADVNTDLKSIQFTLTDIGSRWTDTQVKHRIKHKGKWKTLRTKVGVKLSERLAKKKGLTPFGDKIKK